VAIDFVPDSPCETPMSDMPPVVVRYFDCRGRAQFIRHYLRARELEHTDDRVPLSEGFEAWIAMRGDRTRVGPFHKLPVVHCAGRTIAETLVIRDFLHRVSGDEGLLSDEQNIRHSMLTSSLYNDVMMPIGILIWAKLSMPGVDVAAYARQTLTRVRGHLGSLDKTLDEWGWRESAATRPIMLADCLLWEELDVAQHVFGEHVRLHELPQLARLYREAPGRDVFASALQERPVSVTGMGLTRETAALAEIKAALS
jgi:glutathione S-transferase